MTLPFDLFATGDHTSPVAAQPSNPHQAPLPDHVVKMLIAQGHIDATTGATRRARVTTCRTCHRSVIVGFVGDPGPRGCCAIATVLEVTPLTNDGEALAILNGRSTYPIRWVGDHYQIGPWRSQLYIRNLPAENNRQVDIHVEHSCTLSKMALPGKPTGIPDPYPATTQLPADAPAPF